MSLKRHCAPFSAITSVLLLAVSALHAGPLNPPAGPVAPTGKTLTEVEPRIAINATNTPGDANSLFRITQPGSYYLTGNIVGVANKNGIEIVADGVTIDLRGHTMTGGEGSRYGIYNNEIRPGTAITISDGTLRDWGAGGCWLNADVSLSRLFAVDNLGSGFRVVSGGGFGSSSIIDCTAIHNQEHGFFMGSPGVIRGCTATQTSGGSSFGDGFSLGSAVTVFECVATHNDGTGFRFGNGCTLRACVSQDNAASGFIAGQGAVLTDCTARTNGLDGIVILSPGRGLLQGCNASNNTGDGINAINSKIFNCVASLNAGDGIHVLGSCVVEGSHATNNGTAATFGAGVRVTGTLNVIGGSTMLSNRYGITVPGTNNLIVRNNCGFNVVANYDIGATNNYGSVINRNGAYGAAFSGNAAAGSLSTTDPQANFTY